MAHVQPALVDALETCRDYFDRRADVVDGPYGVPTPNAEMQILSEIDAVLGVAERRRDNFLMAEICLWLVLAVGVAFVFVLGV